VLRDRTETSGLPPDYHVQIFAPAAEHPDIHLGLRCASAWSGTRRLPPS
jgi:hypothetical protein